MTDVEWKLFFGAIGTIIGWLLSQGTDLIRHVLKQWRSKKALLLELKSARQQLGIVLLHYEEQIKLATIGGIRRHAMTKIDALVYTKIFVDTYLSLSPSQRRSYQVTHAQIQSVNMGCDMIVEYLKTIDLSETDSAIKKAKLAGWMDLLQGQYLNAARAYAHADFHIGNERDPDLGSPTGTASRIFMRADEQAAQNVAKFIEFASGKTPAELGIHMIA